MPANVIQAEAVPHKGVKESLEKLIDNFAHGKAFSAVWQTAAKAQDALLHDDMSEFERSLILECREDGMSDDEIQEWLKEL